MDGSQPLSPDFYKPPQRAKAPLKEMARPAEGPVVSSTRSVKANDRAADNAEPLFDRKVDVSSTMPEEHKASPQTLSQIEDLHPINEGEHSGAYEPRPGIWSRTVQFYKGKVLSLDQDKGLFIAELVDQTPEASGAERDQRIRGEFKIEEIPEDQRSRVVGGAEFFWTFWHEVIGRTHRGMRCDFWFRRIAPLSSDEIRVAREEGGRDAEWFASILAEQDSATGQ